MDFVEVYQHYFNYFWDYSWTRLFNLKPTNNVYWVILWCVVCIGLEYFLPKKMNYDSFKRKGFWLDIFYVIFYDILFVGLGILAFTYTIEHYFKTFMGSMGVEDMVLFNLDAIPLFWSILILFVLQDFFEWVAHYAMHRFDFLWAFHKIHHAPEEISFASSRHFHVMEIFVFKSFLYLPFAVLGYSSQMYTYVVVTIFIFDAFFTHCNIKTNFGFFNYIINNPETHFWHHSKNLPSKYGVNFASVLNIWDYLFGTYYLPTDKKPILGIDDSKYVPNSFVGQQLYPFKFLLFGNGETTKKGKVKHKKKKSKNKKKTS